MEAKLSIDVATLDVLHRQAIEEVIGQKLSEHQRLVISTMNDASTKVDSRPAQTLEDWAKVYKGLSEAEIEEIDRIANTPINLTRNLL